MASTTVRVSTETHELLRKLAEATGEPLQRVLERAVENYRREQFFAELDAATPGHAILASNTSSLSITEIGEATNRPDKVVGFHYFYPASIMPLIEVIEGDDTSPETIGVALNFAQAIKKQPITCRPADLLKPGLDQAHHHAGAVVRRVECRGAPRLRAQ